MPNYRNIVNNSAQITVPTSDGDLHIDYYPGRISQKMAMQFDEFRSLDEATIDRAALVTAFHDINGLVVSLMKSWDLMDGEETFPLDADSMMILPISLIQSITEAMMRPNQRAAQS